MMLRHAVSRASSARTGNTLPQHLGHSADVQTCQTPPGFAHRSPLPRAHSAYAVAGPSRGPVARVTARQGPSTMGG